MVFIHDIDKEKCDDDVTPGDFVQVLKDIAYIYVKKGDLGLVLHNNDDGLSRCRSVFVNGRVVGMFLSELRKVTS